jgi:hypothetical protein
MVGITMVLAIVILIFGAAGVFAWLSRPFSDLIPMVAPAAEVPAPDTGDEPAAPPANPQPDEPAIVTENAPAETPAPTIAAAEQPQEAFAPTHQISAAQSVNFRTGPSTADQVIVALPPATPLEYLDEDAPATGENEGDRWMRFRTEDGQEGWVLEILTVPYQP